MMLCDSCARRVYNAQISRPLTNAKGEVEYVRGTCEGCGYEEYVSPQLVDRENAEAVFAGTGL